MRILIALMLISISASAQIKWKNVDSLYQPLPSSVHVYMSNDSLDGKPNIAYYVIADLKDKKIEFTTDTTDGRRLTPKQFYERDTKPLVVMNSTFFEFTHNKNVSMVMRNGKVIAPNLHTIPLRGKDTFKYVHVFPSAIGISKKRTADVAWTYTDNKKKVRFLYKCQPAYVDSIDKIKLPITTCYDCLFYYPGLVAPKWKMRTAVGGGPVLIQNGEIKITNNEERKFGGKAINDKHPRTAMGYTKDNKLIILVVQGRFPNIADGATLTQEAQILKDLGCWEALNLDGGGSSCLLVNGKETIKPSDKEGQRPVPAVFIITTKY